MANMPDGRYGDLFIEHGVNEDHHFYEVRAILDGVLFLVYTGEYGDGFEHSTWVHDGPWKEDFLDELVKQEMRDSDLR